MKYPYYMALLAAGFLPACSQSMPQQQQKAAPKTTATSTANSASTAIPNPKKQFEGEWRVCIDYKGKNVCASYFLVQQNKQICGTWREIDAGVASRAGLIQATEQPESAAIKRHLMAFAKVNYTCSSVDKYNRISQTPCGDAPNQPVWQTMRKGWDMRIGLCGKATAIRTTSPDVGYYYLCPVSPQPPEMNTYYPLPAAKRRALMQKPWVQQCLQGKTPKKLVTPKY